MQETERNPTIRTGGHLPFWLFALLWLAALAPRLGLMAVFLNYPIALDDMYQYDMLARSLLAGNGYRWYNAADAEVLRPYLEMMVDMSQVNFPAEGFRTAHRAPGFPFALAGLYAINPLENRFAFVRLVQCALTALLAPLTALLALRLGMSRRAGVLAGLGMAFYPLLVFYPIGLVTENIFIPLVLMGMLALLRAGDGRRWAAWVMLAGLALGWAMLTRSILAPFVLLGAGWLWKYTAGRWKAALLLAGTAFAVCIPWAVRNTLFLGKPAFVESSLGYNLYIANHPEGNGGFVSEIAIQPLMILDDGAREAYCLQAALGFIREDPGQALLRVVRRAAFFVALEDREMTYFYASGFFGFIPQPWLGMLYALLVLPWVMTAFLAVPGFFLAPQRRGRLLVLLLLAGYALPHLFVISEPRFHLAVVPVLLPFAAWGWVQRGRWGEVLRLRGNRLRGVLAWACLLLLAVLVAWGFGMNWERLAAVMGPGGNRAYLGY